MGLTYKKRHYAKRTKTTDIVETRKKWRENQTKLSKTVVFP
jgi:hypothetical protein